jgi:hypothetical protein
MDMPIEHIIPGLRKMGLKKEGPRRGATGLR